VHASGRAPHRRHAVTLVKVGASEGREGELAALRALRHAVETPGGGTVVYAGLVAVTMVPSSQLENDWSAVLPAQYPSRDAFDRNRRSSAVQRALDGCERSHAHGFVRPALMNLLTPIGLGLIRVRDLILRRKPILPFEPVRPEDALPPLQIKRRELLRLDAYRDIRDDAVVIIDWIQPGSPE
jgi:hypothetical protein